MLIDSNILIERASHIDPRLDAILRRTDLAVASVTIIETLGYHRISDEERQFLRATFRVMKVLPLDAAVVAQAVALREGHRMRLGDAIIAATALVHALPLVTRNVSDFDHIAELRLIDPFAE